MTFTKWVRVCDEGEQAWQQYLASLYQMRTDELLKEFFSYLDYTEYRGEEDRPVKPIYISVGRVMMTEPLGEVLNRLREIANA